MTQQTYRQWIKDLGIELPEDVQQRNNNQKRGIPDWVTDLQIRERDAGTLTRQQHLDAEPSITHPSGWKNTKEYFRRVIVGDEIPAPPEIPEVYAYSTAKAEAFSKNCQDLQQRLMAPEYKIIALENDYEMATIFTDCATRCGDTAPELVVVFESDLINAYAVPAMPAVLFMSSAVMELPPERRDTIIQHEIGHLITPSLHGEVAELYADKISAPPETGVGPAVEGMVLQHDQQVVIQQELAPLLSQLESAVESTAHADKVLHAIEYSCVGLSPEMCLLRDIKEAAQGTEYQERLENLSKSELKNLSKNPELLADIQALSTEDEELSAAVLQLSNGGFSDVSKKIDLFDAGDGEHPGIMPRIQALLALEKDIQAGNKYTDHSMQAPKNWNAYVKGHESRSK